MEVFGDKKHQKNIAKFVCETCDFICFKKGDWNRHIIRPKHLNLTSSNTVVTKKTSKNINIFVCESCDFKCNKTQDLKRHIHTNKHNILTDTKIYHCSNCGNEYKHKQSLHNHKKKCGTNNNNIEILMINILFLSIHRNFPKSIFGFRNWTF